LLLLVLSCRPLRTSCWIVGTASPSFLVRLAARRLLQFRAKTVPGSGLFRDRHGPPDLRFSSRPPTPGVGCVGVTTSVRPASMETGRRVGGNPRAWRSRPRGQPAPGRASSDDVIRRTPYISSTRARPHSHGHDRQEYPTFCPQVKANGDLRAEDRTCPSGNRLLHYQQQPGRQAHSRGWVGFASVRAAAGRQSPGTGKAAGRLPGGLRPRVPLPVVRTEVVLLQRDRLARSLAEGVAVRLVVRRGGVHR
jgi:hypothetical protein